MRWTKQLIPTLREVPAEAEIPSHQLMLRAGLIRKLAGGLYTFLPLGLRALRKVEAIVREEMDRAGALEILMPALHPKEIWERSGRYDALKDVMFNVQGRQDRSMVLGPTHEEIVTDLMSHNVNSYRQLPMNLYQIQTKYRDEIRPRFGLMRAKEFIMKDAYSFDVSWDAADESYKAMYDAYEKIFQRAGLRTKTVEADTGAMGGNWSHEFMVIADAGEDGLVECDTCSYAANLERAESRRLSSVEFETTSKAIEYVDTPDVRTIEELTGFFKAPADQFIKTMIYMVDEKPIAILLPGNREVNEIKLKKALDASTLELADDATIKRVTGAPTGFAGPVGLDIPIYADEKLKGYKGGITGANKADAHITHVDLGRDATIAEYIDISMANDGDGCPRCDEGRLIQKRGIEVGHVFKLGTKYSELLGANFLDVNGKQKPAVMGCYGIGVTRTLQAAIEQNYDDNGIIWPAAIAPFHVELLVLNTKSEQSVTVADELAAGLESEGVEVLYDDRNERPGVKFKDADLLGLPLRVNIGERSLAKGVFELRFRKTGETREIPVEEAVSAIVSALKGL